MTGESRALTLVVPGSIERRTGGTIYDRRVAEGLRAREWSVEVVELAGSFPTPNARDETAAYEALARIAPGSLAVVDGLALGALPRASVECRAELVALVHHPLSDETGIGGGLRERLLAAERAALGGVARIIVTSEFTRARLAALGMTRTGAHDVRVVEPGVAARPAEPAPERARGEPLRIVSVGAVTRRKGYVDLARALAEGPELAVEWEHVGDLEADPDETARLRRALVEGGERVASRVRLSGALDDAGVQRALQRAHAFVHPAHYEGFGMAPREALAHGLPLVVSRGGALAETAPEAASLRFEPGDVAGLAAWLLVLATDPVLHRFLREAALEARASVRSWDRVAEEFAAALPPAPGVRA